jgi:hypothetical protein
MASLYASAADGGHPTPHRRPAPLARRSRVDDLSPTLTVTDPSGDTTSRKLSIRLKK